MKKQPVRQGRYTKVTPARKAKRGARKHWNWFWRLSRKQKIALISAPILAFLILVPLVTYLIYARDVSDQERLMNRNNTGLVLTDKNDTKFYSIGRAEHRKMVPLNQISDHVKKGLIATEDKDFYRHSGFSLASIFRALLTNVSSGDMNAYGGSTLTQQLAKNTLLSDEKSFLRKYQELTISIAIENTYSKDQILEMYLNSAYFGENAFGIEDAAKAYYNKPPKELNLAESTMLVGVLPAPSAYSPISGNLEYANQRQEKVLTRMVAEKYITDDEKKSAKSTEIAYGEGAKSSQSDVAPHFAEMVINELSEKYGYEKVMRSGYQVKTTLDLSLQNTLKNNIDGHMRFITQNGGTNASGIAIDPKSGEIRALVGSSDWSNPDWGKVNIATTARQPGSSFKPIYYAAALDAGVVTPATVLHDKPTDFGGGYKPQNADKQFRGNVALRSAINQSLNIPSVEVMKKFGVSKSVDAAQQLGIDGVTKDKDYGLSLALGSAETKLVDMTNAYAAFANSGQQFDPITVKQISDKFGKRIFYANNAPKTAIGSAGAYLISDILSDNSARAPIFGGSLTVPNRTAAVKTGTTDDSRDAWTIGYTPSLALGVWVGNNDNSVMQNGGSGMAGPIWRETLGDSLKNTKDEKFQVPSNIVQRAVCRGSGGLASGSGANTYMEYFKAGALPTEKCEPAQEPKITVCNIQSKQIETINEKDFDAARHSKNKADCEEKVIKITVCNLSTKETETINEEDFDSTRYSKNQASCQGAMIQVCLLDSSGIPTGNKTSINEKDFDPAKYSKDISPAYCKAPDDETDPPGNTNP